MKESFSLFRYWLSHSVGLSDERAEVIASRLRRIEDLLKAFSESKYGDTGIRKFYESFSKIRGVIGSKIVSDEIAELLDEYKAISDRVKSGAGPFKEIKGVKNRDEHYAALRFFLQFIANMTHRLTDDDVFRVLPTKRPKRLNPDILIPAKYFKNGVIELLMTLNSDISNIMSAHYSDILDKFSEVLDARIKECSKGETDAIVKNCFLTDCALDFFDWRSIFINALTINADGREINLDGYTYFIISDNTLIAIRDAGTNYYYSYPLPQLEMQSHKESSLHCFSNCIYDIRERMAHVQNIIDDLSSIENILDLTGTNKTRLVKSHEDLPIECDNVSLDNLLVLKESLLNHLREYASGFYIDLILT